MSLKRTVFGCEGVKTFQIGSSQVMFHPDFVQAGTGKSVHGGDFALIFLNRPSAYQAFSNTQSRFSNTTCEQLMLDSLCDMCGASRLV